MTSQPTLRRRSTAGERWRRAYDFANPPVLSFADVLDHLDTLMDLSSERASRSSQESRWSKSSGSSDFSSSGGRKSSLYPQDDDDDVSRKSVRLSFGDALADLLPRAPRAATLADVPELVALEAASWPEHLRLGEASIRARIELFAAGQLVVERGHRVVAALFTQRLRSMGDLDDATFDRVLDLHDNHGMVWQLVTIQAERDPTRHLGDDLAWSALRSAKFAGARSVVAVTRCRQFADALQTDPSLTLESHVRRGTDKGLRFHLDRQARVVKLLPGYRVAVSSFQCLHVGTRSCLHSSVCLYIMFM